MSEPAIAAEAAPTVDSVISKLTAGFAAAEAPQVDNSSEETKTDEPVNEPEKGDEPAKAEESEEETKTDEDPEKADEPEGNTEADEEGETPGLDYLTEEELKDKWPRSVPLHAVKQAAKWAAEAKQGKETITSLGGEHFIGPLAKVSSALQDADAPAEAYQPFFEGIVEAAGDDALRKVLGQSVYMAVVQGPAWQGNPATKDFGDELHTLVDTAVQSRFGINIDTITNLADWQSIGAIDGFAKWIGEEFKDADGDFDDDAFLEASRKFYDEIRTIKNNPKIKELTQETLELKRQLENRKTEVKQVPASDIENSFGTYIGDVVDKVLPNVIFANSPLKEVATDTPEMKELKADFRENITDKVKASLAAERGKLLEGYKQGKQSTSVYQTTLTTALEAAINKADSNRQRAERAIAELYGKTRNGKLLAKAEQGTETPVPLPPTQTTQFEPADRPKSVKEVQDRLQARFAAHDANNR